MAYQEVTHEGWFSRLGKSFGGIVTGIILIAAATFLLYWNEGRTVNGRRHRRGPDEYRPDEGYIQSGPFL